MGQTIQRGLEQEPPTPKPLMKEVVRGVMEEIIQENEKAKLKAQL